MARLEEAREPLVVSSCGVQHDSEKESKPSWCWSKGASRDADKKVFISKKQTQDLLGKESPGFRYTPKRQRHQPSFRFGTAEARPPLKKASYPESSNDLLARSIDHTKCKCRSKSAVVLQSSRDSAYYQPGFDGFPSGAVSPGPQRYNPSSSVPGHRFSHAPNVDKIAPKYSMRPATKDLSAESQTPERVGPGLYKVPEACAEQRRSEKPSLPEWSVNKTDRFPKKAKERNSGRMWDGSGDKARQFNRAYCSAPSFSFGTSTRDRQAKVAPVPGSAAVSMKTSHSHPSLPVRKDVMRYSHVPAS